MKITKSKLNKMIKEEVGKLTEAPSVIEKDATASKFNIEYKINYYLKNRKEKNCTIISRSIRTNSSYDSKSEGYSFGSDFSEKEVSIKIIHSNIDDFMHDLSILKTNFSCKNET